jgi:2-iminobutanoate/2-iminopropanoate deaminase
MGIEMIPAADVHPIKDWSQAVRIGDTIFVSGQVPLDAEGQVVGVDDVRLQCEQVFRNLAQVLDRAGSRLELVGKLTVFATSREHRAAFAEVRAEVFRGRTDFPASTFLVVSGLANPAWMIEVEAVAAIAVGSAGTS